MAQDPIDQGRDASPATPLTIAHIARRAGVSAPTVSKVINGRTDVSPQTRRRVEAVIREQGYRPSRRGARTAPLLELAFHEFESEWAGEIIKGAQKVATQHDLGLVLSDLRASPTQDRGWIETVLARRPSGVIVVLSALSDEVRAQLRTRRIPLVVIDPAAEPDPHPDLGPDAECHPDPLLHADSHPDRHPDPVADRDADAHSDSDPRAHPDADADPDAVRRARPRGA